MATESERYLGKARESLASAEADVAAGRNNSAANRAYYAAFQAAVAALIRNGVTTSGAWEHRFVQSEFSGKLVWRKKAFSQNYAGVLPRLFRRRLTADYKLEDVPKRKASDSCQSAADFIAAVEQWIRRTGLAEDTVPYGSDMTKARTPKEYLADVKQQIASAYPEMRLAVIERGPRDFTIEVHGNDDSVWEVEDVIDEMTAELLYKNDVWIVVLPLDESWRNQ